MLLSLSGCWHRTGTCTSTKRHSLGQMTVTPKDKQGTEVSTCAGGAQGSHQEGFQRRGSSTADGTAWPSTGLPAACAGWSGGAGRQTARSGQTDRQTTAQQQHQAHPSREMPLHPCSPGAAAPPLLTISLLLKVCF